MRRALVAIPLASVLFVSACDSGPKGPGQLTGRLTSGPIVLEFTGAGITGFSGSGETRLFFAESDPAVFQVVMVTPTPGEMSFRISVLDVGAPFPAVTAVQAVGGDNGGIANLTGITVEVKK